MTVASSHAWAMMRSAVRVPKDTDATRKRRVARVWRSNLGSSGPLRRGFCDVLCLEVPAPSAWIQVAGPVNDSSAVVRGTAGWWRASWCREA